MITATKQHWRICNSCHYLVFQDVAKFAKSLGKERSCIVVSPIFLEQGKAPRWYFCNNRMRILFRCSPRCIQYWPSQYPMEYLYWCIWYLGLKTNIIHIFLFSIVDSIFTSSMSYSRLAISDSRSRSNISTKWCREVLSKLV